MEPELQLVLGASASASAGAAACMVVEPEEAKAARRLAIGGVLAEGALMQMNGGGRGKLAWTAKSLSTAGAALLATRGRRSRGAAVLGGALVCAGEACLRRYLGEANQG